MTMKKLEEMGLVPLTKKECVEQNGGNSTIPPVKLPDILDNGSIWCCIDIPPMEISMTA